MSTIYLSPFDLFNFHSRGYFTIESLFNSEEINSLRAACKRLINNDTISENTKAVYSYLEDKIKLVSWAGTIEPVFLEYGRDQRILQIVKTIFGSNKAEHLVNQIHFKFPGNDCYPMHQDIGHRIHRGWNESINNKNNYVQIAVALDEVTAENGPLRFVEGTGCLENKNYPYDSSRELNPNLFEMAKPVLMQPGDAVVFGLYVIHGSGVNRSCRARRLFINGFAYPGAYTRTKPYPGEGAGELIEL